MIRSIPLNRGEKNGASFTTGKKRGERVRQCSCTHLMRRGGEKGGTQVFAQKGGGGKNTPLLFR